MIHNEGIKLLAAAIYEIRLQLGQYIGSNNCIDPEIRLSAHLAYALHNQALSIIEGNGSFDLEQARKMIAQIEEISGAKFADTHQLLINKAAQQGVAPEPVMHQ